MKKLLLLLIAGVLTVTTLPAQDWAKSRLEKSPRHMEWVKIKYDGREVNCFVAYPEVKDKAAAVIEAALSAWKEGKSCDDLRKLSPPIHVADERWHGGATITSYTIGEGKPFGPSTRFEVTLEGPPPIGTKKATYTVSTQPAISIALGD